MNLLCVASVASEEGRAGLSRVSLSIVRSRAVARRNAIAILQIRTSPRPDIDFREKNIAGNRHFELASRKLSRSSPNRVIDLDSQKSRKLFRST